MTRRLLRWTFRRGDDVVTCVIDQSRIGGLYQLAVIPQIASNAACMESFGSAFDVLLRHAAIARDLRDVGWTLVAYTDSSPETPQQRALTTLAA